MAEQKKKKMPSTFPNMVIVLTLIAIASSLSLGFVYTITKEPIAKGKLEKKKNAIKAVLPEYDNDPLSEMKTLDNMNIYPARKGGQYVGAAIESEAMGFTQEVKLMVGFDSENKIVKISVVEQKETPGLGTKMEGEWKDQFNGKNPEKFKLSVKKDKGDVDSITAATISARAFCVATDKAYSLLKKNLEAIKSGSAAKEVEKKPEDNEAETPDANEKKVENSKEAAEKTASDKNEAAGSDKEESK